MSWIQRGYVQCNQSPIYRLLAARSSHPRLSIRIPHFTMGYRTDKVVVAWCCRRFKSRLQVSGTTLPGRTYRPRSVPSHPFGGHAYLIAPRSEDRTNRVGLPGRLLATQYPTGPAGGSGLSHRRPRHVSGRSAAGQGSRLLPASMVPGTCSEVRQRGTVKR